MCVTPVRLYPGGQEAEWGSLTQDLPPGERWSACSKLDARWLLPPGLLRLQPRSCSRSCQFTCSSGCRPLLSHNPSLKQTKHFYFTEKFQTNGEIDTTEKVGILREGKRPTTESRCILKSLSGCLLRNKPEVDRCTVSVLSCLTKNSKVFSLRSACIYHNPFHTSVFLMFLEIEAFFFFKKKNQNSEFTRAVVFVVKRF